MSVTIYDVHMEGDVEVDVREFFDACNSHEKDELKDLVTEEFDIDPLLHKTLAHAVTSYIVTCVDGVSAEGVEAEDLIRRTCEELEWKLRNRDFS